MTIASEITRIQTAKANIKTSIENKGVTVPSATTLSGYPALIDSIAQGGGIQRATGSFKITSRLAPSNTAVYQIESISNLGFTPSVGFLYIGSTGNTVKGDIGMSYADTELVEYAYRDTTNLKITGNEWYNINSTGLSAGYLQNRNGYFCIMYSSTFSLGVGTYYWVVFG